MNNLLRVCYPSLSAFSIIILVDKPIRLQILNWKDHYRNIETSHYRYISQEEESLFESLFE